MFPENVELLKKLARRNAYRFFNAKLNLSLKFRIKVLSALYISEIVLQFSDVDEPNKMDSKPFMAINIFNATDAELKELQRFEKSSFDPSEVGAKTLGMASFS